MREAHAVLAITALTTCPKCNRPVDLFDIESLTRGGALYDELLSNEGFGSDDLDVAIWCPHCSEKFKIRIVIW